MTNETGLTLDYQAQGRNGHVRLTARFADGTSYTDKIDMASAAKRDDFVRAAAKGRKGVNRKALAAELEKIAANVVAKPDEGDEGGDKDEKKRPSQADILVKLAQDAELFHTPGGHDSEGYATVNVNGHSETWPIQAKAFKRWLGKRFFDHAEKAPSSQAIQDAVNVIAGTAVHNGEEREVAVRLAQNADGIWLDLANEQWQAVHVSPSAWKVVADCPVKFIRKRGMLSLPAPVGGGNIDMLRALVNVPDDDGWRLFVAWLVAAFRPGRPFPILAVNGEQGSAKSTLCRMARALIDPNIAALRRPPRDDRDLLIAATNGWIVAFDNLSGLPALTSDALCMLATGGGFSTRELYTDSDEKLFDATRPVMINGIEDLATRSDLLDRCLALTLPVIPDERRRDEEELWRQFDELRPSILGALLDAVVVALRNRPGVKLTGMPRMADFACWIVAAEPALGWPAGKFLAAYSQNRGAVNSLAIESAIIGPSVVALVETLGSWQGTAGELLAELEAKHTDEKTRRRKEWPTGPRKLSGELRRLAPIFRREGIEVDFDGREPGGQRRRLIRIDRTRNRPSQPSQAPHAVAKAYPIAEEFPHGGDDRDGVLQAQSECPDEEVVEWTA